MAGAISALQQGKLSTLRLTHAAAVARATLPRQLDLLRAMMSCERLRIAQLVNVGLGDAWGHALAAALPSLSGLRILDVSHNLLSSTAARAVAEALPFNHSLLWFSALLEPK